MASQVRSLRKQSTPCRPKAWPCTPGRHSYPAWSLAGKSSGLTIFPGQRQLYIVRAPGMTPSCPEKPKCALQPSDCALHSPHAPCEHAYKHGAWHMEPALWRARCGRASLLLICGPLPCLELWPGLAARQAEAGGFLGDLARHFLQSWRCPDMAADRLLPGASASPTRGGGLKEDEADSSSATFGAEW